VQVDIRGLELYNVSEEAVIELARITYKSSGISLYLPKRICDKLRLDKSANSSLVLVAIDNNCMFLVKDTNLAAILKPQILELRKKTFEKGDANL
jgi:hypothetical protein